MLEAELKGDGCTDTQIRDAIQKVGNLDGKTTHPEFVLTKDTGIQAVRHVAKNKDDGPLDDDKIRQILDPSSHSRPMIEELG
ncbi:unnamed protein product [marine sediment metagenome]|uniref:Uncharacterized protein n=1 Tax=marine sediment metagenome TaxID=412755 RepID=X0Z2R0_9ZZZZ